MTAPRPIRAAGGVLYRTVSGLVEIGVVHRPRYDDWSLPKGKLSRRESATAGAVREIAEEVGARVALSRRLGTVDYRVLGVPKRVTYFAARYLDGQFRPNDEVDAVEWLSPGVAAERLSYPPDRAMLSRLLDAPLPQSVVILVRHAKAGKRSDWTKADELRPLDAAGQRQAAALVGFLSAFGPTVAVSANRVRCRQTIQPFATAAGLTVRLEPAFNDEIAGMRPDKGISAVLELAAEQPSTVVCSQGTAIPAMIESLVEGIDGTTRKGAAWVLSIADGAVIAVDLYDAEPTR